MSSIIVPPAGTALPDHMQLPETDGAIVENFQEHPQGTLLTESITPVLKRLHPDNHYLIGADSGIYWRYIAAEPLRGCKSPDWFYVPNVPPMLGGTYRRSYVLWQEHVPPRVVLEFVSGDGSEERDPTPETGKFWVYEQAIRAAYYGIFDSERLLLEVYQLVQGRYQRLVPNARGRFPIAPLGVELGIWQGEYGNMTLPWLRWWDAQGNLLPAWHETTEEERQAKEQAERRAEEERQAKEQARQETEAAVQCADRLAAKLRALGIDPEA
jgi:Uma2 family endonuclease